MDQSPATIEAGLALIRARRFDDATRVLQELVRAKPGDAEALHLLGVTAIESNRAHDAIELITRAIASRPNIAAYHNNLGNALRTVGRLEDAGQAFTSAIAIDPRHAKAHYNLAKTLRDLDQIDEAMRLYQRAIELDPYYAKAHNSLGLLQLLRGDFANGWDEYEWRWRRADFKSPRREFSQPRWDGAPMPGKTILLWPEQGMGDFLQFVRYAPMVAERTGARVIVECHPPLRDLVSTVRGVSAVIALGDPLPAFDVHISVMSLPWIFQTREDSIPASVPYVFADPAREAKWRQRLRCVESRTKVGLVWAGNRDHRGDRERSIDPSLLEPLSQAQDIAFVSLQKLHEPDAPRPAFAITDFTDELHDFADTAALMSNLDLIVTVDTAPAHLAGALALPTWTLLPFAPDWRWMLERGSSPWYPTMRLFRQSTRDEWTSVIDSTVRALQQFKPERT